MINISTIPGVSAATAADLARLGLFTSDDLLRSDRVSLAAHVPGLTVMVVRGWQGFGELMTIAGMTPEGGAALQAAGADGAQEFAGWPLARARTALAALSSGIDDETIVAWMKDAVRLTHTGVLNGNVRLKDGTPVEGAVVTVAGSAATSDARGRFRITRLPLDRKVTVTVLHPTLGYKLATSVPVTPPSALVGHTFVLAGRRQLPKRLTELRGDRLPPIGSATITTRAEPGAPDPSDILMLIDRYAGGDARAASRFFDFDAGRFVRRTYRIAAAALPAGLNEGDDIKWTGTLWTLAHYSPREIAREVRLRRVKAHQPKGTPTTAQIEASMRAAALAFSDPEVTLHGQ